MLLKSFPLSKAVSMDFTKAGYSMSSAIKFSQQAQVLALANRPGACTNFTFGLMVKPAAGS